MINEKAATEAASTEDRVRAHRVCWYQVGGRPTRTLVAGTRRADVPEVVLLPGLGSVSSLVSTSRRIGGWTRCTVLDLPGFGHDGPRACAPTVPDVATATATWLRENTPRPVVLAGHSTGAQAVLRATLAAPETVAALLLAGPTFAPQARRTVDLVRAWARTSRREPPSGAATVAGEYRRAGVRALTRYVRSGLRDRPENALAGVRCPVWLATGEHDYFAPPGWVRQLAAIAPHGRAVTVAGAHAFPYSHPDRFAELVAGVAGAARR